jgi:PKD repeat protein
MKSISPLFLRSVAIAIAMIFFLNLNSRAQSATQKEFRKAQAEKYANQKISKGFTSSMKVDSLNNIEQSITNVLFGGCVDISNLTYTGPQLSIGYFVDQSGTLGIDSGIVMTTGTINNIDSTVSYFASTDNGTPGDALLESQIPGYTTNDASIIEFDFIPYADTIIGLKYIFASEEYPEYVCSQFNDVFGFFISGPNPAGGYFNNTNLAMIPGTNLPVAINTVNNGTSGSAGDSANCISLNNSSNYVDNEALGGTNWCYDGYTVPFTIMSGVYPDSVYHFKIAIADAGDHIYDSGVFLKGGSFLGNTPLPVAKYVFAINTHTNVVTFHNFSQHADRYEWDFGDGTTSYDIHPLHTYQNPGVYNVKLTAINTCTSKSITQEVNFYTVGVQENNQESPVLTISTIDAGLFNIKLKFDNTTDFSLQILNCNGQLIYNKENTTSGQYTGNIDLSKYSDGIYFLNVIYGNKKVSYKLVK